MILQKQPAAKPYNKAEPSGARNGRGTAPQGRARSASERSDQPQSLNEKRASKSIDLRCVRQRVAITEEHPSRGITKQEGNEVKKQATPQSGRRARGRTTKQRFSMHR